MNEDVRRSNVNNQIATSLKEFLAKKVNAQNAFDTPFIESIKNVIDMEPLQCVGQMLDAGAKIYGYRVDNTHNECYSVLLATGHGNAKNAQKSIDGEEGGDNGDDDDIGEGLLAEDHEGNVAANKQKNKYKKQLRLLDCEDRDGKLLKKAHIAAKKFPDIHKIFDGVPSLDEVCGRIDDYQAKIREEYLDCRIGLPYVVDAAKVQVKLNRTEFDYRIEQPIYRKVSKGFAEGCTINFVHSGVLKGNDGTFLVLHTSWPNDEPNQPINQHNLDAQFSLPGPSTITAIYDQIENSLERALSEKPSDLEILQYCCEDDEETVVQMRETQQTTQAATTNEGEGASITEKKTRNEIFQEIGFNIEILPIEETQTSTALTENQSLIYYMISRFAPYIDLIWHSVIKKATQTDLWNAGMINMRHRSRSRASSCKMKSSQQFTSTPTPKKMISSPVFSAPLLSTSKKGRKGHYHFGSVRKTPAKTPLNSLRKKEMGFNLSGITPTSQDNENIVYFWARPREYPIVYLGQIIQENPMTSKNMDNGDMIENDDFLSSGPRIPVVDEGQIIQENLMTNINMDNGDMIENDDFLSSEPRIPVVDERQIIQDNLMTNINMDNGDMIENEDFLSSGPRIPVVDEGQIIQENLMTNINMDNGDMIENDDFEVFPQRNFKIIELSPCPRTHVVDGGVIDLAVSESELEEIVQADDMVSVAEPLVPDDAHWRGKDPEKLALEEPKTKPRKTRKIMTQKTIAQKKKRFVPPLNYGERLHQNAQVAPATDAEIEEFEAYIEQQCRAKEWASIRESAPSAAIAFSYDPLELFRLKSFVPSQFGFLTCVNTPIGSFTKFVEKRQDSIKIAPTLSQQLDLFLNTYFMLQRMIKPRKFYTNSPRQNGEVDEHFDLAEVDPDFAHNLTLHRNVNGINDSTSARSEANDLETDDEEEQEQMKFFGGIMNLRQIKIKAPLVKRAVISILTSDELTNDALNKAQQERTENSINGFECIENSPDSHNESSDESTGESEEEPEPGLVSLSAQTTQGTVLPTGRTQPLQVKGIHTNRDLLAFMPRFLYGPTKRDLNVINAFAITLHLCNEKNLILEQEIDQCTNLVGKEGMMNFRFTSGVADSRQIVSTRNAQDGETSNHKVVRAKRR